MTRSALLAAESVTAGYGTTTIVSDVSLEVQEGQCAGLIGPNGHGKTTLLHVLTGSLPPWSGTVHYAGRDVTRWRPFKLARAGVVHVPQGDLLFDDMTVHDNLLAAIQSGERWRRRHELLEQVFGMFPRLEERRGQLASTLSGGERRMVAIGRGLMMEMRLLILDEPSLGLAPRLVEQLYEAVGAIAQEGIAMIIVEENPERLERLANVIHLLDGGRIVRSGPPATILTDRQLLHTYLGIEPARALERPGTQ
jgi:branched-chain amino acid transport system ATP-binding protein